MVSFLQNISNGFFVEIYNFIYSLFSHLITTSSNCYLLSVDLLYSLSYHIVWRFVSMDIVKVFGTNVKRYRQALGISQETFAEKCGLHRTYISAIECYRRNISLENIQRIADALEIETYKLFIESEETQ